MTKSIMPKEENAGKGFCFSATDEQIAAHQKLSVVEIFRMMESHARFLFMIQTPEEKERMRLLKGKLGG